jgi:hypothetical protein
VSANLELTGIDQFRHQLASLPAQVRGTFKPVLERAGDQIVSETSAAYASDGVSSLGQNMRVESSPDQSDLSVRIRLSHPTAHLREFGTVDRFTSNGAYRGRQPARPVFIPIVERVRSEVGQTLGAKLNELERR